MPMASATPSSAPSRNPRKVAEAVTQACSTRLRLPVIGWPTVDRQKSLAIWSGVGSTGRSIDQAPATRSRVVQSGPMPFSRSMTCGALSQIAARYHTARMMTTTVRTGSTWPSASRRGARSAGASMVMRLAGAQRDADPVGDGEELRRLADIEGAVGRQVAIDDLDDAAGPRAHHHDLARQEHGLGDRVGDEDHCLAGLLPQPQQLLVEVVAGDLVERAKRLVHQQQLRLE